MTDGSTIQGQSAAPAVVKIRFALLTGRRSRTRSLWPLRLVLIACALCFAHLPAHGQSRLPLASAPFASLVANRLAIDVEGRLIAEGAVEVWQGQVRLRAERLVYDPRTNRLSITGPLVLSEGAERLILADAAELSADLRDGLATAVRVVLEQRLQIAAAWLERREGQIIEARSVIASSCTVCPARPRPLWALQAARIIHDARAKRVYFERAALSVAGTPVLVLPRLSIPDGSMPRARGFLVPSGGYASRLGVFARLPWFWPLDEARDLTLSPFLASSGAVALGFRWRQALAAGGYELWGLLAHDSLTAQERRSVFGMRALAALPAGFRLALEATDPSDRLVLDDYGLTSARRLRNHATLERVRRDEWIFARAVAVRSLWPGEDLSDQPRRWFEAAWERRLSPPGLLGDLTLAARALAFERESRADGDQGRDVARISGRLRWQRQEVIEGGLLAELALASQVEHLRFRDDSAFPDPVTQASFGAELELRWPLGRATPAGGSTLIEPIVRLTAARRRTLTLPNDDHLFPELDGGNLFAPLRSWAFDAPDDGSRIDAGLRLRHEGPSGVSAELLAGRIWRREGALGFPPALRQPLGTHRSDWLLAGRIEGPGGQAGSFRMLVDEERKISRGELFVTWPDLAKLDVTGSVLFLPADALAPGASALNLLGVDLSRRFENGIQGSLGFDYDFATQSWSEVRARLDFRNECLVVNLALTRRFSATGALAGSTRIDLGVELVGLNSSLAVDRVATASAGRRCR